MLELYSNKYYAVQNSFVIVHLIDSVFKQIINIFYPVEGWPTIKCFTKHRPSRDVHSEFRVHHTMTLQTIRGYG